MNRGLLRGAKHDFMQEYGTNEGLALWDASTTSPTFAYQEARYLVQDRVCYFTLSIRNISNAGSGVYMFLAPPVAPWLGKSGYATPAGCWISFGSSDFGIRNATYSCTIVPFDAHASPKGIPQSRRLIVFPSPTNAYSPPGGTATVTAGTSTKVVTHGSVLVPDNVLITPLFDTRVPAVDGKAIRWWVDTITATQFTIHAETEGNGLHNNTATVANGATSTTVTHHFVTAAPYVTVTPKTQPSLSGCVEYWVDTVGASTFKLNAVGTASAALSASLAFDWQAERNAFEAGAAVDADAAFSWKVNLPVNGTDNAGIYMTDKFPFDQNDTTGFDIGGWYLTAQ